MNILVFECITKWQISLHTFKFSKLFSDSVVLTNQLNEEGRNYKQDDWLRIFRPIQCIEKAIKIFINQTLEGSVGYFNKQI